MKKIFVLSMALLLCVMSVFVGCSKEETEDKDTTAETTAETTADTTAEDTTAEDADTSADDETTADTSGEAKDSGSTEENAALVAYAKEQQKALDAAPVEGATIACTARGNALVYSYTYEIEMNATAAQTALDALDSTYSSMLTLVQITVPTCESIIIEFLDQSGNVLASKTY